MPISLTCPKCNGKLRVADNLVGKKIKCPKCAALLPVAAPEEAAITAESPPTKPENIAAAYEQDDFDDEELARPRKIARDIRRDSAGDAVSTIIPYKNGRALLAYYFGVFSFIPCVGLILGPAALVLGILGLRYVKANPTAKGTGHAIAGVIMGVLTTLGYWGLVFAMIIMGGFAAFMGSRSPTTVASPPMPDMGMQMPDFGQQFNRTPFFSGNRDLVNPQMRLDLPAEAGRVAAVRVDRQIFAFALSPDGKTLGVGGLNATQLFELAGGPQGFIVGQTRCLAISPDGRHCAVGRAGKPFAIEMCNTTTNQMDRKFFVENGPRPFDPVGMAFTRDGTLFAASSYSTFKIWDTATGQERGHNYKSPKGNVVSPVFSPNGATLAVGVGDGVLLWDVAGMRQKSLLHHAGGVRSVAYSADGKTIASGSADGIIKLWNADQQRELHSKKGYADETRSLCFSPDGKYLAEANGFAALRLWDVATGRELANRKGVTQGNSVTGVAFSADGKMLISTDAAHGILKAWDVAALASGAPVP